MNRILAVIALLIAVGVAVVAVIELDSRRDDDAVALPTTSVTQAPTELPSPLSSADLGEDAETPEPDATDTPAGSTAAPAPSETERPTPSETETPDATAEAQAATSTPDPIRTPTPEPVSTPGPTDPTNGQTAETGAESWPVGLAIALAALVLRGSMLRRRSF